MDKKNIVKLGRILSYWLIGSSLALAGAIKLSSPTDFLFALKASELLPQTLSYLVAYCLPILELAAAYMLLFKPLRRSGLLIATILYAGFSAWLAITNILGIPISCGCFGSWDPLESNPLGSLARSLGFLGICLWLIKPTRPAKQNKKA